MDHLAVPFFLARRILFGKNNSYSIRVISAVCFGAIAAGSFALTLIFAIMQGFESTTTERLQSIHPQIIMQAPPGEQLNWPKIADRLSKNPNIAAYSPTISIYGVLHNPQINDVIDWHSVALIKGIDPANESSVSKLATKIKPCQKLETTLDKNRILIGSNLAKNLELTCGDLAEILIPNTSKVKSQKISFQKIPVKIGGTIQTGIADLDDSLILTTLDFLEGQLDNVGITEINLKLKSELNEDEVIDELRKEFKLTIFGWKTLYSPIVSALKLEKYVAISIAILVIFIASMTLIALLFMLITKHIGTIATLRILGLSINKIRLTFLLIGTAITTCASAVGILIGTIVAIALKNYQFIELPDIYYITGLPIYLSFITMLSIWLTTSIIALIAIRFPLRLINNINLASLLKTKD